MKPQQPSVIPYLRIYYDRGSGRVILDEGIGTQALAFSNVVMSGQLRTQHAPPNNPNIKPRFWMSCRQAIVYIQGDMAYISSLSLPATNGVGHQPVVRRPPVTKEQSYASPA